MTASVAGMGMTVTASNGPAVAAWSHVALLPWGDLFEDYLDEIGVSLEDFATRVTGGWLYGYVESLRLYGIRTTIFCFSKRIAATRRWIHAPTGAHVVVIKASAAYRVIRRLTNDPHDASVEHMFGDKTRLARRCRRAARDLAPYLATPVWSITREIRRARCGAILCQEYEDPRFDVSIAVGGMLRIPVFATYQGGNWQRSALERPIRKATLGRSAGLVIGSAVESQRVVTRYAVPVSRIAHIFNPLDPASCRPGDRSECRRQLGFGEATRIAIWHGRIDIHRKGLDVLLSAWRLACARGEVRNLLLLIVGDGVDADRFAAAISPDGLDQLHWVREYVLDRERIQRYLSAADFSILPSRHEGFPVAPLEAMACGLPVIAAAASGVPDIFADGEQSGGVVVPTDDAPALAAQIVRLSADEELCRQLGVKARARIEQAFSPTAVGAQLAAFFKRGGLRPS